MTPAPQKLREILMEMAKSVRRKWCCPACGQSYERVRSHADPALCARKDSAIKPGSGCGHIFIVEPDGTSRNLTKTELELIREMDRRKGNKGMQRQAAVVAPFWG